MKKLTRDRVVPIISASISWLIVASIGSGFPSLPKFANSRIGPAACGSGRRSDPNLAKKTRRFGRA
jgi:hypothetical protein